MYIDKWLKGSKDFVYNLQRILTIFSSL